MRKSLYASSLSINQSELKDVFCIARYFQFLEGLIQFHGAMTSEIESVSCKTTKP